MNARVEEKHFMPVSHIASLGQIESGYWWYVGRIESTKDLLQTWQRRTGAEFDSFADIGCGTGGFAREMRDTFRISRTLLVDGERAVLELPKRIPNSEAACLDLSTAFALPLKPQLVTCMDVIEHLADDVGFLRHLYAQMPSGAALVLSVPAHQFLFSEWDRQLGHFRRYAKRELRAKLTEAGFSVERVQYTWSFLAPIAPYRKFRTRRYQKNMEFERTPPLANAILIALARLERALSRLIPPPFGTSLITLAVKK